MKQIFPCHNCGRVHQPWDGQPVEPSRWRANYHGSKIVTTHAEAVQQMCDFNTKRKPV